MCSWETPQDFTLRHAKRFDASSDHYSRSPFAMNIKAGTAVPSYVTHPYHTKVPPQGIVPYIEHYTEPGDLVLDPFSGSGMTGVAALSCPSGARNVIMNDLSPAACHIALNHCISLQGDALLAALNQIVLSVKEEFDWLYGAICRQCGSPATIHHTIWSDVFECICGADIVFWQAAVDHNTGNVLDRFRCPSCGRYWTKKQLNRVGCVPVFVRYLCSRFGCGFHEHSVSNADTARVEEISAQRIPYWYPTDEFPHGRQTRKILRGKAGIRRVDEIFTCRNLRGLARLWNEFDRLTDEQLIDKLRFAFTGILFRSSRLNRLCPSGAGDPLPGTLYVPSLIREDNVLEAFSRKVKAISRCPQLPKGGAVVRVGSATCLALDDNVVDYVFTDPPYGESLQYAELNFLWESWLRQFTEIGSDCVMNYVHHKDLEFYSRKMRQAFTEMYRVLKPNRWASVVFHNTDDRIWAAIQLASQDAGLEVVTALAFDKQHGTFNQVNMGKDNAAGFDVVLNLHKRPFTNGAARAGADVDTLVLDAITAHLRDKPIPEHRTIQFLHSLSVRALLNANVKIERVTIPYLDTLLRMSGFKLIDGKWYLLSEDVNNCRLTLMIEDETSAIGWVRDRLATYQQSRGEIDPHWKMATLNIHLEKSLDQILAENFWQDELTGKWRLPTEEERHRMEDTAVQSSDRAKQRLLNDIESGRAISTRPSSEMLSRWIRRCIEQRRWEDVLSLFPLLNPSDFSVEDWWELQAQHSFAQQQLSKNRAGQNLRLL